MDLIAYSLLAGAPELAIEPADLRREWMDATTANVAYRCLPLSLANQAGWVVRCPVDVVVTWDGTAVPSGGLTFASDDAAGWQAWSGLFEDHFGYGILTFKVPYLFRTAPGYGLLVRGAPNFWIENAQALEGLVETYWLEGLFTVNWKILEPGRGARFRRGDPIAFLQPYPLDLLERIEPRVVPIEQEPELRERFASWVAARARFYEQPGKTARDWQKDYFKGVSVAGETPAGHRTKLDLKPFRRG